MRYFRRVDAAIRLFVLQDVHDVEQGKINAACAVRNILLDQESQVGRRIAHLVKGTGMAVEQALDADGDDD